MEKTPAFITPTWRKIKNSPALSPFTPIGLVRKVWFDIQLCFTWRGREGNHKLSKESFVLRQDENGLEYLTLAHNPETKNHKDPTASDRENLWGFMFECPGDPLCPVESFKKFLSKCPVNAGGPGASLCANSRTLQCGSPGSRWESTTSAIR